MASVPNRGAAAFRTFIENNGITKVAAAAALGVSDPTIHDWCAGSKRPRHEQRLKIERWTRGAVPSAWWITDDESACIDAIRPFVANDVATSAA